MKTLAQLIKFYQCDTQEQFFTEMSNCLETSVNLSNYQNHLSSFEQNYNQWLDSHK